ncbi:MAG: hypothetical protein PHT33_07700 [bacterium]|nr:hypothetical protein [bacterium]
MAGNRLTEPLTDGTAEGDKMYLYFFDDEHIAHKSDLVRVPGPVTKLGAIMGGDDPDSPYNYDLFAGTVMPLDGGGYRAYFSVFRRSVDIFSLIASGGVVVCESSDGLNWHQVPLNFYQNPQITPGRVRMENIPDDFKGMFIQPQVVRLNGGTYRMYAWFHGRKGSYAVVRYLVADSTDGYSFTLRDFDAPALYHPCEFGRWGWEAGLVPMDFASMEHPVLPADQMMRLKSLRSNDATYVYYSEEREEYTMYTVFLLSNPEGSPRREGRDNAESLLRAISVRTSRDGLSFSEPRLVLVPDELDPMDQQFYYMSVHKQDGWHIGFVGDYEIVDQTMDLQLAFSRDGVLWQRLMRSPFISRGNERSFDSCSIYASSDLIDAGDDWILMYRGGSALHNYQGEHRFGTGLARFGKRRFMGLHTDKHAAFMLTKPFILTSPEITIDADIRGHIRAELCDPFGIPLEGYRREDFIPISGDNRKHILKWRNKTVQEYRYDALSVRFEITDGTVYAVGV